MKIIDNNLTEVIGLPGSGKSYLCAKIIKTFGINTLLLSNNRKSYDPNLLYFMINPKKRNKFYKIIFNHNPFERHRIFELLHRLFIGKYITDHEIKNYEFLNFLSKLMKEHNENSDNIQAYMKSSFATYVSYFANKAQQENGVNLLQDGGVIFQSSYILNHFFPNNSLNQELVLDYFNKAPYLPSTLIFVEADIDDCIKRFQIRKIKTPSIYNHLSYEEIVHKMVQKRILFEAVLEICESFGIRTINYNNLTSEIDLFNQLNKSLHLN